MRDFAEVEINGNLWRIVIIDDRSDLLRRSDGIYTHGVADNNTKTVFISDKLDADYFRKVLIHEITHIFCFEYGLYFDIYTEELIADFIATYGENIIDIARKIDGIFRKKF